MPMPTRRSDRPRLMPLVLSAAVATAAAGCWGEPAPLRASDPSKARAAFAKKLDSPDSRPIKKRSPR